MVLNRWDAPGYRVGARPGGVRQDNPRKRPALLFRGLAHVAAKHAHRLADALPHSLAGGEMVPLVVHVMAGRDGAVEERPHQAPGRRLGARPSDGRGGEGRPALGRTRRRGRVGEGRGENTVIHNLGVVSGSEQ